MIKILKIKCPDSIGLISKISNLLAQKNINIVRLNEFVEPDENYFFCRAEIESKTEIKNDLVSALSYLLGEKAQISLNNLNNKKVLIYATKEPHCLGDLLLRAHSKSLNIDVQAVLSNHNSLRDLVEKFDVPYHHVPHQGLDHEQHSQKMQETSLQYDFDYIILAKYMRILPNSFVDFFQNQVINIHHSFLPAFIGANPYKQAHQRGVKIIGATSHFVTSQLDEGPIIEQDILHIDHRYNANELSKLGKDIEQIVLAQAVKYVVEERVFVHKNKTIVFK